MGKRSDFPRIERDFYQTPATAVQPLLPHLGQLVRFAEPCAGNGALADHLANRGNICVRASDVEPQRADIAPLDALNYRAGDDVDTIITNCPWHRPLLHELIVRFSEQRPTWLLLDSDWLFTKQAAPFLPRLRRIVTVGRVKWIPGSKHAGKDNACWLLFDRPSAQASTLLFGREQTTAPDSTTNATDAA
nr:class I SAM-dependent methyltransferase [uncultured Ruegeria sp.]